MRRPLGDLFERALAGEPALGDELEAVFRRADALRRRRTRLLLITGAVIAAALVLAGYLATTTVLPARGAPHSTPATRAAETVAAAAGAPER